MSTVDATAEPRRLTRKGEATRERILTAAADLMFENGVSRTTVDDVQKRAGVSPGQLYHYFEDKDRLVRAVINYQSEVTLDSQQPMLDQLNSMSALRAWRDRVVDIQREANCEGGCRLGSMASELSKSDDTARSELANGFARWESLIRAGLHDMKTRGALRADADPDRLSVSLLAALEGGILLTVLRRSTVPVEVALDTMLDHIESMTVRPAPGRAGRVPG